LATAFLREIDDTIAQGQLAALAAATGGIRIVWTRKLNSTAGRANWRRELVAETAPGEAGDGGRTYRHHAFIELAEKVIDDEGRRLGFALASALRADGARPAQERARSRVLPSGEFHDQQCQRRAARQGIPEMVPSRAYPICASTQPLPALLPPSPTPHLPPIFTTTPLTAPGPQN
jgi:hypothetical protein